MDAGIATEDNLDYLRQNGFHYIVVNRGKSDFTPDDTAAMKIIRKEDEFTVEVCRKEKDEEVLLFAAAPAGSKKTEASAADRNSILWKDSSIIETVF